ncbi:hypothetical protein ACC674_38870, partial [Rhizobium ruizarguesonis]
MIEFGVGTAGKLGKWADEKGYRRTLVISDAFNASLIDVLELKGEVTVFAEVTPEPDTSARMPASLPVPDVVGTWASATL